MPLDIKQRKKDPPGTNAESEITVKSSKKKNDTQRRIEKQDTNENSKVNINYKRILIRCLVIIVIIVGIRITHTDRLETFASQKEEISKKSLTIPCSQDYVEEIEKFSGCVPLKCGRFVTDSIVSLAEVESLLNIAKKGIDLGGSSGGASILDLHSGALSKGSAFINIYAVDKQRRIITEEDFKIYRHVKDKIKATIVHHFGIKDRQVYLTHPTFFSRITSRPAHTIHDEYWHPHVDKETYKSFHYTSLLYLTDFNEHFAGGRFVFVDNSRNMTVEPRKGRLLAFTSGSENLHFVEPVSSGTRYAITVSFTCDPKHDIKELKFHH